MPYPLPRNKILKLNAYEFGWLSGALGSEIWEKRMLKECPAMFYQFQILFAASYVEKGHPLFKQAMRDVAKFKKKLKALLTKQGEDNSWL